ncbi:hypothetical protein ACP70R_030450 [Stipagrostis hirtigluma subsp. patula]
MPNMNIQSAVLKLLTDFPIDLEQFDRREQLKKSGLGKSRPIFNKSTRFEDMRRYDDERAPYRRPQMKKPSSSSSGMDSRDDDLDADFSQQVWAKQFKAACFSARSFAFGLVIRPLSKIDPEQMRARAKSRLSNTSSHLRMNKKLPQLKAPKKKNLQVSKVSAEAVG